ncbi:MAG: sulfite exporter TauE/SafE family protein [Methylomonas sp.]|nr:sulfite exporter TauE/SafE family protein [Methylomonas sp.]
MATKNQRLNISGMQCTGCEDTICDAVRALPGIASVKVSYREQIADISFDPAQVHLKQIRQTIADKGYGTEAENPQRPKLVRAFFAFVLLFLIVGGATYWGKSQMPAVMQMINPQAGYAILLGIGYLTGFHCIGMCGGFVVSYTNTTHFKSRQMLAHLAYGIGKVLSYSAIGAGFGWLGASIAITPQIRGIAALAASLFLVIYGVRMLNIFGFLRRFVLRLPESVTKQVAEGMRKQRNPLVTGLFSGLLLGCGPLQAMYIMAAGTGDSQQGAMILLMFSLGTLLPLWGFGLFATLLSTQAMQQLVRVSGVLVIVMGVMMAQHGMMFIKGGKMIMPMQPKQMQMTN